jgi:hypothetical protein
MEQRFNIDAQRATSHQHLINHLSGPLSAGALSSDLEITSDAQIRMVWEAREPLIWLSPRRDLENESWSIQAIISDSGQVLQSLHFAPYTELGSSLPLYIPTVNDNGLASTYTIELSLQVKVKDTITQLAPDELANYLKAGLIEGLTGRLLFLLSNEKQRIRRQIREMQAMQQLEFAERNALDRIGADLGVARFQEDIRFNKTSLEGEAFDGEIISTTLREPDADYRQRLLLYRPFIIPNKRNILSLLNGAGDMADPNAGLLGKLGFMHRFSIEETDNNFGVAIHILAVGNPALRINFLNYIKRNYLIYPVDLADNNERHEKRLLSRFKAERIADLRQRLATAFTFNNDEIGVAPTLAERLDLIGRCLIALGEPIRPRIEQGQADTEGSRYELGLGVRLAILDENTITTIIQRLTDYQNSAGVDDLEVDAALRRMEPQSATDDPEMAWFFAKCGMRTIHRLDSENVYLSHFPVEGMVITGPHETSINVQTSFEVRYHAEGDPGKNLMLVNALNLVQSQWTGEVFEHVEDADAQGLWDAATAINDNQTIAKVLRAAGLPVVNNPSFAAEPLKKLPVELYETIRLSPTQSDEINNNAAGAIDNLKQLVALFEAAGVASILPFLANNRLVLVLGAIGLPQVGINLSQRRATGFRWYLVPLEQSSNAKPSLKAIGSSTQFTSQTQGLYALVALGYARTGKTDAYEYRVELPEAAILNLKQYEFLMNLLERSYPIGVEINTYSIRRTHVDLDEDGTAEALRPTVSRTYRPFLRKRNRGQQSEDINPISNRFIRRQDNVE